MSPADAAFRKDWKADAVSGIPVGVVAYTVVGPGMARVGGVVSTTETWNDAGLLFP
jgi:hypothetical protein